MPSREIFWNIQFGELVYLLGALLIVAVMYGLYRRLRLWRLGSEDDRLRDIPGRIRAVLIRTKADGLWHKRIVRNRYAGLMHLLIFGGFGILLMGPFLDFMSEHVYHFMEGNVYLGVSLMLDVGGLLALAGLGMAAYRRYVTRPSKLNNVFDDAMALSLLAGIIVTGYLLEGLRIAASELDVHPGWSVWSPVGFVFAKAFYPLGTDVNLALHKTVWWGHMIVSMGAMGYVALSFTKLAHIFASPLNMFLRTQGSKGVLKPIEITEESVGALGASKLQDLTWKDLIDLDACTRCGRCQEVCPANMTDKPLSPKLVIQELRAHMVQRAPVLLRGKRDGKAPSQEEVPLLAGGVVTQDELWSCTTCGACEEACPVYVEPVKKIMELRRNLVLEQGEIPPTLMAALRSVQDRGHPWKGASASRTDWTAGFEIKNVANDGDAEFLFWVGCTAALQESSMNSALALARILDAAGVKISILGHEESCCGHQARRIGDEYLFQCQAQQNIETLKRHNVKKIITACPHCFHTLKEEYPQFGGDFEVVHHTEFLLQLVKEGRLKLTNEVKAVVAYQDPCYLARYHGICEAPRELAAAVPGVEVVEMAHCGTNGICCGAGGGRMWMEEEPEQRINRLRAKEAVATGANTVLTACPFCLQMFKDGLNGLGLEEPPEAIDLVELLERSVLQPLEAVAEAPVEAATDDGILSGVSGE
ncbi:MAG TPA: (Fe-S)-binding protein [Dehalococcoidia bacterium]|nr:(Fe-S)-binding protein [Dehalococcoidia bacterium]